jgi:hypothetical protein
MALHAPNQVRYDRFENTALRMPLQRGRKRSQVARIVALTYLVTAISDRTMIWDVSMLFGPSGEPQRVPGMGRAMEVHLQCDFA